MTRTLAPHLPLVPLIGCMLATVAASQPLPADADPLSPELAGLRPLWQGANPAAWGPLARNRAPGIAGSLSLPMDASWEGFRTPGVTPAVSHPVLEWQGKLVIERVTAAGAVACDDLVLWDGTDYATLPDAGYVQLMTTWNGQLVVASLGPFPTYGLFSILRFNGSTWDLLGVTNDYVFCMTEFDGKLVIGGRFTAVEGVPASKIAWFDGSVWSAIGSGLTGTQATELSVHGGELYAGGSLTGSAIQAWNGTLGVWEQRTGVVTGVLNGLASDGANLYATGQSLVGAGVALGGLGRWDGAQWNGIPGAAGKSSNDGTVWSGKVITTISWPVGRLSQWDGTSLTVLPGDSLGFGWPGNSTMSRLGTWGSRLVASGNAVNNGVQLIPNIAIFDGSQWSTVGVPWDASMKSPNGPIHSMLNWNGNLVVAGAFGLVADSDHYEYARGVGAFDGTSWTPLGGSAVLAQYRVLASWGGDLIVGGYSLSITGTPIQRMARWNGTTWNALGSNAPDFVDAMQEFQGDLYATEQLGAFNGLAKWNGTSWQAAGAGVSGIAWTLGVHGDSLIVGGTFTQAGGAPAAGIAVWDGAAWHPLGAGLSGGPVDAVGSWNGLIVAGGRFTSSGATPLDGAAYWDGSGWHQMGGNVSQLVQVREYGGELFASGVFRLPDDTEVQTIAKWTGSDWQLLGSGTNAWAFAFHGDHLYGAGSGLVHGHVSHGLSRVPISAVLDAPRPEPPGSTLTLTASPNPARGGPALRFTLPRAGRARLTVHDVSGRLVAVLLDGPADAGDHHVRWSARARAGVYFARLVDASRASRVTRFVRLE